VHLTNATNLNGAIAGGQIGFNWQAGMVVFGAELDGQWAGQQGSFLVNCGAGCTAAANVKIRSIATGRGRIGLAFDWIMPYVTGGAALVNGIDNLNVTVGGVTADFQPLSGTRLGWTAGAGVEVALWSNWSAKLEYLYISANGSTTAAVIPSALGAGFASTPLDYRDNIVRVGLNYRFGPRGGPGVLEASPAPRETYAISYDVPPDMRPYQARRSDRPLAVSKITTHDPGETRTVKSVQTAPGVQTVPSARTAPVASASKQAGALKQASALNQADVIPRSFADIGDIDDTDALAAEPKKSVSKKGREKEDDDNLRMKRIMSICTGC
jgi:outer membrane immunogenic protein